MAVVSKHHSKEEGEGNHSEGSRVSLAISRHTIHVGDLLIGSDDVIGLEESRRVEDDSVDFIVVVVGVGFEF